MLRITQKYWGLKLIQFFFKTRQPKSIAKGIIMNSNPTKGRNRI